MKTVSIIRDRGQLTIPDSVRRLVPWANPLSAVTIAVTKPNEIVIKPHQPIVDWNGLWQNIQQSRNVTGNSKKNALEILETDRASH